MEWWREALPADVRQQVVLLRLNKGGGPILLFGPGILPQHHLIRVFIALYNALQLYDPVRHSHWRHLLVYSSNPIALRMGGSGRLPFY